MVGAPWIAADGRGGGGRVAGVNQLVTILNSNGAWSADRRQTYEDIPATRRARSTPAGVPAISLGSSVSDTPGTDWRQAVLTPEGSQQRG